MSGNKCKSDCRSRGREIHPCTVPYFRGDWSWNNFYGILLHSAESFKKVCCQLQVQVCAGSTGQLLVKACPGKSVVRWTDRPAKTIAVDLGRKATKQSNKQITTSEKVILWDVHVLSEARGLEFGLSFHPRTLWWVCLCRLIWSLAACWCNLVSMEILCFGPWPYCVIIMNEKIDTAWLTFRLNKQLDGGMEAGICHFKLWA